MAQDLQYTPASFAIPVSSQQLASPPQGRDRPIRPQAPRRDPAVTTTPITMTKTSPVQVHPAYKPPPTMNSTPVQVHPAYKPQPTTGSAPVRVHPASRPPPQKPSLVQVDAESFTRLVQQVQSQQAVINSLVARIDILEQSRFSHFDTGASTITSSHHHLGEDSGDAYDSGDSDSPIQQLLSEISRTQEQQQQAQAGQQAQQQAQQQIHQQVQTSSPTWTLSNYVNPIPPPDQVPDMAAPPEGLKFEFALTIDNGRGYPASGPKGASMVLSAWTGPHGYRVFARRTTIVSERYTLTMCCAFNLAEKINRPPRVKEEPLTDGERPSRRNRTVRKRNNYKYDCPFRFIMRQVDKDSGLFEVRWMSGRSVAAPHNHGPDPHAMVPYQLRGFQVLIR
ncbi:hypothetical protein V8F06_007536 [Rhypophila decipiens]